MYHEPNQVMLFGLGLVGSSINDALASAGQSLPYDWYDASQRAHVRQSLSLQIVPDQSVHIVWAAGNSGFGSSDADVAHECVVFREIVDFAAQLSRTVASVTFHLVSSAGGLFEGQEEVGQSSVPAPIRPYGFGKLRQEKILSEVAASHDFAFKIYRPSSVYGFVPGKRLGLVSTLILNTIKGRETPLYARMETKRDFVLVTDAAQYIVQQIKNTPNVAPIQFLASGQAMTISDVVDAVATVVGQSPRLAVGTVATNEANISFDPAVLPHSWAPTELQDGIQSCVKAVKSYLQ